MFPASQKDMTRVAFIVNILRLQGIEVGRATAEVKLAEGTFPAGSLIVKRNQPYGRLAKILLEKQVYPDASPTTYDDTGWTMGLMNHADVREIADKAALDVAVQPVDTHHHRGRGEGQRSGDRGARQRIEFPLHLALSTQGPRVPGHRTLRQDRAIPICPPGRCWWNPARA